MYVHMIHEDPASYAPGPTFEYLHGLVPRHGLDDISNVRTPDGRLSPLGDLISDQCPYGITIVGPDGATVRITGSVLSHIERAKNAISPYNPKELVDGSKSEIYRFPRIAVSEALLNAVVHRDYSRGEDIIVTVSRDEIMVLSPGSAHKGDGGIRNPDLVAAMELLRLKGHYRHGLMVIRKAYSRSTDEPRALSAPDGFVTILPAVKAVMGHYQAKVDKIVDYMDGRGGVSFQELIDLLHVSRAHTATTLKRMEDDGIVFDMFVGRMRRYYLCQRRGRE